MTKKEIRAFLYFLSAKDLDRLMDCLEERYEAEGYELIVSPIVADDVDVLQELPIERLREMLEEVQARNRPN